MKYSEERPFFVNALFFILSVASMFIIPLGIAIVLLVTKLPRNVLTIDLIPSFLTILVVYLMYAKDINREVKKYFSNFKENFRRGFKYYIVGLVAMIMFNLIINMIVHSVSDNENIVRDMLFNSPVLTMFSIIIIAPLSEELIFRKSLRPLIDNKWAYATISGLLFAAAHLIAGEFVLSDLLFILPYGSLGFAFAIMDYETKTTCTSMVMHALHNGVTGIMLLITYYAGVL